MKGRSAATALAAAALAAGSYAVGVNQHAQPATAAQSAPVDLWQTYQQVLKRARYVDLTHTITPNMPVWKGFGPATFGPTVDPATGQPYTYAKDGFEATKYTIATDQFGTQLDPPAHWAPEYPGIDELPATYAVRPLVVISIVPQVKKDPKYALKVSDIQAWEKKNGRIPEGSVVMVRSDWSKKWTDDPAKAKALAADPVFPGVSLDAIKFLQLKRHILFHGHEPLDTDTTPTLEGESWLMHHGYTQAEGVANLDKVPQTGCLISIGYPKFKGGLGGYARYIAICPPGAPSGTKISGSDAPLRKYSKNLHWDTAKGYRVR
ncbi:cyclase family protein [Candidatus Solirubrobacter pratensis]|uniref:cyclase family protein n=1 Tax=Candidatus Solirubrobacter pratensis TaxID=1298857 RepID=UPI0004216499|nr:cyclase family protein [Candidatus Solirubrobacter pratensis]